MPLGCGQTKSLLIFCIDQQFLFFFCLFVSSTKEELAGLLETGEKLKQQQQESTRRENVLVMRLATKEQEMQDLLVRGMLQNKESFVLYCSTTTAQCLNRCPMNKGERHTKQKNT